MKIVKVIPYSLLLIFLVVPFYAALSEGVCCYDDSSFAVLAKNIANGMGYALTINYLGPDFSLNYFNPALGQGPAGVLPVAGAVYFFGNTPTVPGVTQVVIELILLSIITTYLLSMYSLARVSAFLLSSLFMITLISGKSYAHWYAMLGESVAALFLLCGFLAWNKNGSRLSALISCGFFFSLAVLTKEISAIFVFGFVVYLISAMTFSSKLRSECRGKIVELFFAFAMAGLLPFIVFEFWKLYTLGWNGFIDNWVEHFKFIEGSSQHDSNSAINYFLLRSSLVFEKYYIGIPLIVFACASSLVLLSDRLIELRSLIIPISIGMIMYLIYFTLMSSGPARYFYIWIVIFCFYISFPILVSGSLVRCLIPPMMCILIIFSNIEWHQFYGFVDKYSQGQVKPANASEIKTLEYIDLRKSHDVIYTTWWAHVSALEYLSVRPQRFSGGAFDSARSGKYYVIINTDLARGNGEAEAIGKSILVNKCKVEFKEDKYTIYICNAI